MDLDELRTLDDLGPEYGDVRERTANHGDLVAGVKTRAGLAVLVDFVGHGVALGHPEPEMPEKVGQAGEEADAGDLVLFALSDQGAQESGAGAGAAGLVADHNGANLSKMGTVKMERATTEELRLSIRVIRLGDTFSDGEIANVLANFSIAATEKRAIARERIHQIEDIPGILQVRFVDAKGDGREGKGTRLVVLRGGKDGVGVVELKGDDL